MIEAVVDAASPVVTDGAEITWELLPRLAVTCSECRYRFQVSPSISMQWGINTGHAGCPHCKALLHVEATGPDTARAELFSDYLDRTRPGFVRLKERLDVLPLCQ